MQTVFRLMLVLALSLAAITSASAAGQYHEVTYPPSAQAGELQLGVTYTIWIPDGITKLRGVIVHQHGCGAGACKGGETAAYDLHWQALAKKWDCALLGPSYHQDDKQNCRLWCDPRNGSAKTFLKALGELAVKSKHPELETVPWCLWGHSGGGFWASLMQTAYPDRIVALPCSHRRPRGMPSARYSRVTPVSWSVTPCSSPVCAMSTGTLRPLALRRYDNRSTRSWISAVTALASKAAT
jgi:hypothetical protein